jgi:Na+-driven multidrug efflux pump
MLAASNLFPKFYNTTDQVRTLASQLICVMAAVLPLDCFSHGCYFTMRSGGKTLVTFLFDSCFSWVINVPVAYAMAHYTSFGIVTVYAVSVFTVIIKCVIGGILVHKRFWVNTLSVE